ncbi:MAG: sigma-70 family RNA polymerase sigma factor [Verrucomicrobiota bacterium]|nr:sigma-70 family RNA polymerase sigma factor [Verrucomicrobiota bacterium]
MEEPSDQELVAKVLEGDRESFTPLVVRYQPRLFAMARRYARREDEVEDVVQEILLKAFRKLDTYRHKAPFEHWLMRLAVRTCYDFLRKHQRNREHTATELGGEKDHDIFDQFGTDNEAEINRQAAKQLVDRMIAGLLPEDQMVITMLELERRPVKEISKLTGWSESLVKVRAFRARGKMRKMLAQLMPEKYL